MQSAFMQNQVGLDLDGFLLDHVFPDDYDLEEEAEVDIYGEPLFEDELANQAVGVKVKHKSRRAKAYTTADDKLLCFRTKAHLLSYRLHVPPIIRLIPYLARLAPTS
ncbi:Phospholipid-transporting ATPase 1 [Hordeum vulgare]|nr:Phospholipid-transporting ATPase 1 [Hordeum vulgare]